MGNKEFNELIHAPIRLRICSFLSPTGEVEFPIIRDTLQISDSVLSKHLKQLENAGYVKQRKGSANGRKRSWVYMTAKGRKAFSQHLDTLQNLINASTE